jgi:ATP-binding cassette, subfamily B, bacterial
MTELAQWTWEAAQLPAALDALLKATGLSDAQLAPELELPAGAPNIEQLALQRGVEAVPVEMTYCSMASQLAQLGPSLIEVTEAARTGYLAVLGCSSQRVHVVTSQLERAELPLPVLYRSLSERLTSQPASIIETWLDQAEIAPRRRVRARTRLLDTLLAERSVSGIWLLRNDPGTGLASLLRAQGVTRYGARFLAAAAVQIAVTMAAWFVLGRAILQADLAPAWLSAFVLLLCSGVPLQLVSVWSAGRAGLGLATVLKQRLLCGALRLDPSTIRVQGSGGLLAMVSESEAIERAGLEGTLAAFVAGFQLIGAGGALALGAGGPLHASLLLGYCFIIGVLMWRTVQRQKLWTAARFGLSGRFVEQVQGHRTRLTQGLPRDFHTFEDAALGNYALALRDLDHAADRLTIWPARGWFCLGMVGLTPALLNDPPASALALSLGAILQAQQAFGTLSQSLNALLAACVAWQSVAPMYRAASELPKQARVLARKRDTTQPIRPAHPTLELRALGFGYKAEPSSGASRLQLQHCTWLVREGEKWLLTGASGSGKSTLVKLITGVHRPASGLIMLDGLDPSSLGTMQWRQRVASAPQFHENHILSAPLSFNLLMGRQWPPSPEDLQEAQGVCRALGLGTLLSRMPSGIHQLVGETGWQLSHGERSRVFLARALLQHASLVLLDESFGALDPECLRDCMQVVRERCPTLVVVAHP